MKSTSKPRHQSRKGSITVLAAFMTIAMLAMVAFSVDVGFVLSAKEELQRTADAAAIAACWELGQNLSDGYDGSDAAQFARLAAEEYASENSITGQQTSIDTNPGNDPNGDVVIGYLSDFYGSTSALDTSYPDDFNCVRVRVHKNSTLNGEVPYFFARIFGLTGQMLQTQAMAGIIRNVNGFRIPADGGNIHLLPFALDEDTYNSLMAGNGDDEWKWNPVTKQIESGYDGIREVNLYPQGTGSPGNRGTVDIGSSNNSSSDIARQIVDGISPEDFEYVGGEIKLDPCGELELNGDTGISAGFKDELASIIGHPRIIPIFSEVNGPGNTAQYTIVCWFGIRICDVKLTGPMSKKHVTIQACPVVTDGIIPSPTTGTSNQVFSTVVLLE